MRKLGYVITVAAIGFTFAASPALAFHCPKDMKKIDAVLNDKAAMSKIKPNDLAKAKGLRSKGEAFHKAGKHQESVDTLAQAMKILGIN